MNDQMKYYKQYERIMKMELEQSVVETFEFQSFSEIYPHIAESSFLLHLGGKIRVEGKFPISTRNVLSMILRNRSVTS